MADASEQTTETTQTEEKPDLISRAEAKKAFEARDKAKKEADELRKRALSEDDLLEYQTLKAERVKAEEDRAKKAGEFETLKQSLVAKHTTELDTERKARTELETKYTQEKIEAAFLGATDLFGGHDASKTVLTGDIATAYLGRYVAYEDVELAGKTVKAIVVRDTDGQIIVDGKGNPAKFADAISELISQLPNRDRILRGSGKTGSGSSGGAHGDRPNLDLRNLTPEQRRDPKVLAALRSSIPAGGVRMGVYDQ